jgi:hypothetical protein
MLATYAVTASTCFLCFCIGRLSRSEAAPVRSADMLERTGGHARAGRRRRLPAGSARRRHRSDNNAARGVGSPMIECIERSDVTPVCPHCCAQIERIWVRALKSAFGRRYVYFCSQCRKVLGVSHRKGFWMG